MAELKDSPLICLDTNYLIRGLLSNTGEANVLKKLLKVGIPLAVSSIAWYEFLCGPVGEKEIDTIKAILKGGILPFGSRESEEASRLFNAVGRARRLRVDAMIAAVSICAGAEFATSNVADFQLFREHGLALRAFPPTE